MRLKILFFPLMLVISISVVLLYGWPWFTELQQIKTARNENRAKLEEIKMRSGNIERLNSVIKADDSDVKLVYEYLPQGKREERVIDSINYIALNTTGITLSNISLGKESVGSNQSTGMAVGITGALGGLAAGTDVTADASAVVSANTDNLKYINADIAVIGRYEDIKIFLNRLQNMQIYNAVRNISIEHVAKGGGEADAKEVVAGDSDLLMVDIDVAFGYMDAMTSRGAAKTDVFGKEKFDLSIVDQLRSRAEMEVPGIKLGNTADRKNPFKL